MKNANQKSLRARSLKQIDKENIAVEDLQTRYNQLEFENNNLKNELSYYKNNHKEISNLKNDIYELSELKYQLKKP